MLTFLVVLKFFCSLFHKTDPLCTKLFLYSPSLLLLTMMFPHLLSVPKAAAKYSAKSIGFHRRGNNEVGVGRISHSPKGLLTYPKRTHSACCPPRTDNLGGEVNFFSLVLIKLILRRTFFEFFSRPGKFFLRRGTQILNFVEIIFLFL